MKKLFLLVLVTLLFSAIAKPDNSTNAPVKPYPIKTCLVCDMRLGDMGKAFVFEYKGQEIKVCAKSEKSAFDKNPDKYMKKLADTVAKLKK